MLARRLRRRASINTALILYQAFEMKSATHLTNLSSIKNVNKSIPDMAEYKSEMSTLDIVNNLHRFSKLLSQPDTVTSMI